MTTVLLFLKSIPTKVWLGIAAVLLVGASVAYCQNQVEDRVEQAEELGEEKERSKQLEATVENVEKANDARKTINDPGAIGEFARYHQCLRSDRTPENCERFMPDVQPVDDGS